MLQFAAALHVITAFFEHVLRKHAEMADKRNASVYDPFYLLDNTPATLGFDSLGSRGLQAFGILGRIGDAFIAAIWKVRGQQSVRFGASGGPHVVFHVSHGDMGRIGIAEHDHAQRVPHQDQRDAGLIEKAGHWEIVRREGGDLFSTPLHFADCFGSNLLAAHRLKLPISSSRLVVAVPILPTTMPAAWLVRMAAS